MSLPRWHMMCSSWSELGGTNVLPSFERLATPKSSPFSECSFKLRGFRTDLARKPLYNGEYKVIRG
eukprot:5218705-Amphidinium_carterae.1